MSADNYRETPRWKMEETTFFEVLPNGRVMTGASSMKVFIEPEPAPADPAPSAEAVTDAAN